jgi:hypothetical protein
MFKYAFLGLLLTLSQNILASEDDNCSEIVKKTVTASEFFNPDQSSFSKLKSVVVNQALQDAVQQVTGTEIRNFSSLSVGSINGDETENFGDSKTSKTKGEIQSYDIISQKIINMGDGKVLEVIIDASVCLQDRSTSKDILLIGDFIHNGKQFPKFNNAIKSVFSQQSNSFELGSGHPNSSYHDIVVTGRIDNISKEKKVDRKAMEDAQGMAVFQEFLGAMNQGKNNRFGNIFDSIPDNTAALNTVIVKVSVSVSANHKTDNRNYTATGVAEKEVPENSVKGITYSLVIMATKIASKDLYIKLNTISEDVDIMDLLDF